jgi:hypothetical protein
VSKLLHKGREASGGCSTSYLRPGSFFVNLLTMVLVLFFSYFVFVSLQARMRNGSKLFWVRVYFQPKTVSKFSLEPKHETRV